MLSDSLTLRDTDEGLTSGDKEAVRESAPRRAFDVVMITTVHPALDARIFHREAKTLANAGLSVCVVGRHKTSESVDGIWIEGLPESRSRLERLLLGRTAFRRALELGGQLFIFHDPELFWVALPLSLWRKRIVYDCHENLPAQVLQKEWIPVPLRRLLSPLVWSAEWLASRMISGVIVARDAVRSRFPKNRTILVRNFPTAGALRSLGDGDPLESRQNVVIYAGALSKVRGIGELVRAFDSPELAHAQLLLVGDFDDSGFRDEILAFMPSNARWVGRKSYSEVLQLYKSAKLGMLLLHPTPSHRHSLPIKLFEYLGAGLPVIASNFPEFAEMVEGCGALVNPTNVDEIRTTIQQFLALSSSQLAAMSSVARHRVLDSLTWEPEGERLLSFCARFLRKSAINDLGS